MLWKENHSLHQWYIAKKSQRFFFLKKKNSSKQQIEIVGAKVTDALFPEDDVLALEIDG